MRRTIVLALATTLLLSLTVAPAMAARKAPTGDRIRLVEEVQTFAPDTPFFIRGGFAPETNVALAKYRFELDVDGVPWAADFKQITVDGPGNITVAWVFNFPAGMTDSHVFTGRFYVPCDDVVSSCEGGHINSVVVTLEQSSTVTFIDE